MPGIYERVRRDLEDNDPIATHLLVAAIYLVGRNVFTATQVRDALNAKLRDPLTTAELTDLNQILTQAGLGTATARLDYMLRVQALLMASEFGVLNNEAVFRSELGLT
jgi:hypothetical protein